MPAMAKTLALTFVLIAACTVAVAAELPLRTEKDDSSISIKQGDRVLATYQLQPQKDVNLSVESGCYFHPLKTPAGVTVTGVGPADHPHHRGVFLAWVEMRGSINADFWGWGEHAPKDGRRIVNRELPKPVPPRNGGFEARNQWMADEQVVLD